MSNVNMQPLLIELGTDELPVKALPGLAQAFFDGIVGGLEKRGIALDATGAKPLYTPRRLAVLLPGVATEQPEQKSEVLGPYLNIALDANGAPTKALEGFAAKAGIDWTQLEKTSDAKGERFVHRSVKPGVATRGLLAEIVAEAIAAMPIPKPMRWGAHTYAFARPVHWLVMLLGDDVAPGAVMEIDAGRVSRGHRFMQAGEVVISSPAAYVDALRAAKVLVDPDERRARIVEQAEAAAREVDGIVRIDQSLLEEVNGLNEWPVAVRCTFEREFLQVPQEALISTMEANQKFFPVLTAEHRLSEHFIGTSNIESKDVAQVRKGYERVIRPRFADARFFYEEDLKQGLDSMNAGLATVKYQDKLGSMADKVARVAALAQAIAPQVGVDAALARRAAGLSKADLQSRMVNEFPELQGIAGRYYAGAMGEPGEVSAAIDEGWMPRNASDDIAPSKLGQVLAISERLDTLAGGFAAGLKPTGNKDPFALRRNALGLARTVIEGGIDIDLPAWLQQAGAALPVTASDAGELQDFILDRLRSWYEDRGFNAQQFDAVAALRPASLTDFDARLNALGAFAKLPEAAALAAANKRARNILRKAEGDVPAAVEPALFAEDAERALADALHAALADTDATLAARDYVAVLTRLAALRPSVDAFFDQVMVNAEDPEVRGNRLALLKKLADRLGAVAAIEHLSA
ncbi:glycine--tRNA ligase subunit beta [Lysobacter oculi]|uniref:Glycine--tRNA ligase beta subunit n=1 Tax=Solilutibacter oculi TaxID=2698682 RepID=A0A344J7U2_9GAMM|nr:glycine--tRNA ligase subunit beta [Lysobacter oculi]AXA85102.1 glycine--tRNA ligase subunit beta [Lysobacter oculi]